MRNPHTTNTAVTRPDRTAELLQQLEQGVAAIQTSDDFQRALRVAALFHHYSFNNQILIAIQCPTATRVAGYTTWQRLGRQVKRGERGIAILAPRPYRVTETDGETDDQPEARQRLSFRPTFVFDIGQTDGPDLPTFAVAPLTGADGADRYTALVDYVQSQGLTVTNDDPRAPGEAGSRTYQGYYNPTHQLVYVKRNAPAQMLKTLIHELAHHLDADLTTSPPEERETVAEATAFVVAAHVGIDTGAYSFPYVAHWTARENGADLIKRVMDRVHHNAQLLIEVLDQGTATDAPPTACDATVSGSSCASSNDDPPTTTCAPISLPIPQTLSPAA